MSTTNDRPNTLPWPPLIYVGAAAIAVLLHWLWPLPWLPEPARGILFAIGWLAVAGAIAIYFAAMSAMRRARTTIMPHKGAAHLVTSGPFSFTRNPIYLANTMLMIGVGLIGGIVWFILLAPFTAFATAKLAIEGEERHLQARFGKKYLDYRNRVRRWL